MPSPVAHALAGAVFGLSLHRKEISTTDFSTVSRAFEKSSFRGFIGKEVLLFGSLGVLPDVDFLFGSHSTVTHSMGAVVLLAMFTLLITGRRNLSITCAIAYGSHLLLDWLGTDATAPYGIMLLWPYSQEFFLSNISLFEGICREFEQLDCWLHNLTALMWELLILGPAVTFILIRSRLARSDS